MFAVKIVSNLVCEFCIDVKTGFAIFLELFMFSVAADRHAGFSTWFRQLIVVLIVKIRLKVEYVAERLLIAAGQLALQLRSE